MPRRPPATPLVAVALLLAAAIAACSGPVPPTSPASLAATGGTARTPSAAPTSATGTATAPTTAPTSPSATPPPTASPDPGGGTLTPALARRLQSLLDQVRANQKVPGLSAAVLLTDGSLWTGTSGDRQLKPAVPVDTDTVFSIASITKTFVAADIMKLVDDGALSLSDHLAKWVPSVPNAKRITIAELLGHTSGVYNYFENPIYNSLVFKNPKKRWTFDQIMALVKAPYCAPGACYHYSNTNYVLLGRIIEMLTAPPGHVWSQIASAFETPLGLGHTTFQPDQPTPADHAHAYTGTTDWTGKSPVIPTMSAATVAWAAGAMVSTPTDLARWASALYTGKVLPQADLDQMLQFKTCHDNYGLGTREYVINGRVAYGHLGSLRGYTDAMWYFPAEGATIVLLSNLGTWNIDAAVRKLANAVFTGIGAAPPAFAPTVNTRNHDGVTLRC